MVHDEEDGVSMSLATLASNNAPKRSSLGLQTLSSPHSETSAPSAPTDVPPPPSDDPSFPPPSPSPPLPTDPPKGSSGGGSGEGSGGPGELSFSVHRYAFLLCLACSEFINAGEVGFAVLRASK